MGEKRRNRNKRSLWTFFVFVFVALAGVLSLSIGRKNIYEETREKIEKKKAAELKVEASKYDVARLSFSKVAKSFSKSVEFSLRDKKLVPKRRFYILYGNKEFGYFQSSLYRLRENSTIEVSVIPPVYGQELEFRLSFSPFEYSQVLDASKLEKTVLLGKKKWDYQPPLLFERAKGKVNGAFKHNFFLVGGVYYPEVKRSLWSARSYYVAVFNKLGQLVWAHLPKHGKSVIRKYPALKQLAQGHYGVSFGEKWSYFEIFDYLGNIKLTLNPKEAEDPYIIHHDFQYLHGEKKILTLGHKLKYVRNALPFMHAFLNPLSIFKRPLGFLSTPLIEVDLLKNKERVLWDPFEKFNPLDNLDWARSLKEAVASVDGKANHFYKWGEAKADIDWTHGNSVEPDGNGWLLSFRNINKVVKVDQQGDKVLWTWGNDSSDTIQPEKPSDRFYHQHHVQRLSTGQYLMMDNHSSPPAPDVVGSRAVVYELDHESGKARIVWKFQPDASLRIFNRGSAAMTPLGNVVAFYPRSVRESDHLVEVDQKTGQVIGHMQIYFADIQRSYSDKQLKDLEDKGKKPKPSIMRGGGHRAVPISAIGMETFVGRSH